VTYFTTNYYFFPFDHKGVEYFILSRRNIIKKNERSTFRFHDSTASKESLSTVENASTHACAPETMDTHSSYISL